MSNIAGDTRGDSAVVSKHAAAPPPVGERSSGLLPLPPAAESTTGRRMIVVLSACMALQMTAFVMTLPLFARRFSEFNASVESLAASAMAYALAATVAAPFMGALADRLGRKRLVLGSLAAYGFSFVGFLCAPSALALILIRGLAGLCTAGLIPAATSIVADIAPTDRRAQWIGILSGAASAGWIVGPLAGGLLYDGWGYEAALSVAILCAAAAFVLALLYLPQPQRPLSSEAADPASPRIGRIPLRVSISAFQRGLPAQLSAFVVLLSVPFVTMLAWAFMEPSFMYFAYEDLNWSSSMLGGMMSTFGVAVMLGEVGLGRLSDLRGRKPVIALGLVLFSAQFLGLAFFRNSICIAISFVIAGLGNALFDPALTASILDISPAQHRGQIIGLKTTAGSVGSILGPALVVMVAQSLPAGGIFLASAGMVILNVTLLLVAWAGNSRTRKSRAASLQRRLSPAAHLPDKGG